MPWIKKEHLYVYIALLLILIMAIRTPLDSDMWWHLKAGEESWINREVYSIDTFSHTRSGSEWINHSWLSQVLMYLLYKSGGYYAMSIWVGLCAVSSMALVYFQMQSYPIIKSVVIILAGIVASVVWSPRPQIFSLVLFSLMSFLLYKYKINKKYQILFWLIPLMLLWANLHAGYSLGFILLGSVIAGEVINNILARDLKTQLSWKEIGMLVLTGFVCLMIILINPYGIEIWKIPFNTVGLEILQDSISEWASPDFHQAFQQPMLIMLIGIMVVLGLSDMPMDGADLVSLAVFSLAALIARRNFGPFAIVGAPILARHSAAFVDSWLKNIKQRSVKINGLINRIEESNQDFNPSIINLVNSGLLILLITASIWKTINVNNTEFIMRAETGMLPRKAVDWMIDEKLPGKIFNDYNWGGYLIWNMPEYPVFSDGRTDLFGDEILYDYIDISSGKNGWDSKLEKYGIETLLIQPDIALEKLATLSGWNVIYKDEVAVILRK